MRMCVRMCVGQKKRKVEYVSYSEYPSFSRPALTCIIHENVWTSREFLLRKPKQILNLLRVAEVGTVVMECTLPITL